VRYDCRQQASFYCRAADGGLCTTSKTVNTFWTVREPFAASGQLQVDYGHAAVDVPFDLDEDLSSSRDLDRLVAEWNTVNAIPASDIRVAVLTGDQNQNIGGRLVVLVCDRPDHGCSLGMQNRDEQYQPDSENPDLPGKCEIQGAPSKEHARKVAGRDRSFA